MSYAKSIIAHPTLAYLHPFGSSSPENIEILNSGGFGPLLFCYDQEPLLESYNDKVFCKSWDIHDDHGNSKRCILLNTERDSSIKKEILSKFGFVDCHYFFHAFVAADWYRGYQYCTDLLPPTKRSIKKKYITFNRLTGGARVHRSFLVAELAQHQLLNHGHVSYSDVCPDHGPYDQNILAAVEQYSVTVEYAIRSKNTLDSIHFPLRIDNTGEIPNGSQTLGAIPAMMESFLHVVTETCYWDNKTHLTEKIFKPIVARQPFVLLGCANNLKYLRSYGFKTFDAWWDESYDSIEDPIERLQAVVKIIKEICSMSDEDLESMLLGMQYVLDHNYNRFYSKEFIDYCWNELTDNLQAAIAQLPPQI